MTDTKVSALTAAADAADADTIYLLKGGADRRATVAQVRAGLAPTSHTHTASQISDSTTAGRTLLTAADAAAQRTALNVANGATANATDAQLRDRATHTGAQAISTVTGLQAALDGLPFVQVNVAAAGTRAIVAGDLRKALYYTAAGALEVQITADLGADFECVVMVAPGAGRPTFVASGGQTVTLDGVSNQAKPGPSIVYIRRVAANAYVAIGLTPDATAWTSLASVPAAISAVGALTPQADRLAYYTGASAATLATLTAFGRSLIDDADATAARTTLGLGTAATSASTAFAAASHTHSIANVTDLQTNLDNRPVGAPYVAGRYYNDLIAGASDTLDAALASFTPIMIRRRQAFDRLALEIVTPQAGSTIRLGLYADAAGQPGARLEHSAALASTAAGLLTHTISRTLDPGRYWFGFQASNSTVAFRFGTNFAPALVGQGSADGLAGPSCYGILGNTYANGLPATAGAVTWLPGVNGPMIWLRAV
jgi:hypothetical protein